jgi:hypothetical protein
MGWFRRPKQSDHTAVPEEAAGVSVPDTDWANLEAVLAEWREDPEPPDWGRAMEMFEEGPVPAQRLNVAEYLTRRLKLALFDRTALPDELTAEVCRRVLVLLANVPSEPAWQRQFVPRLARLPLAIMRDRGWQPVRYGGDGTVEADIDIAPIEAAVATSKAPDGNYLAYFFHQA